jgi:HlyD family secretion protein
MSGAKALRAGAGSEWARAAAALVVVAGLAGGGLALRGASRDASPVPVPAAPAAPTRVHALGRLEPGKKLLRLAPPTSMEGAKVELLRVEVGDRVGTGQELARLDTHTRRSAALAEAEARVAAARSRLDQIRAGAKPAELAAQRAVVARMESALGKAERDLTRAQSLAVRGVLTAEELDEKRSRWESARLELEQARATLESLSEVREVDVRLQECEILAAEAGASRARAELEAASVRAPIAGQVLRIHARPGERTGDDGLLELGETDAMYAVAEVYEADVARVREGAGARVVVGSSGLELPGVVEEIGLRVGRKDVLSNDPVSDTDARVVEVRVRLGPDDSRVVAGLSNARVEVSIEAPE